MILRCTRRDPNQKYLAKSLYFGWLGWRHGTCVYRNESYRFFFSESLFPTVQFSLTCLLCPGVSRSISQSGECTLYLELLPVKLRRFPVVETRRVQKVATSLISSDRVSFVHQTGVLGDFRIDGRLCEFSRGNVSRMGSCSTDASYRGGWFGRCWTSGCVFGMCPRRPISLVSLVERLRLTA